jgi:hypothetical protein
MDYNTKTGTIELCAVDHYNGDVNIDKICNVLSTRLLQNGAYIFIMLILLHCCLVNYLIYSDTNRASHA